VERYRDNRTRALSALAPHLSHRLLGEAVRSGKVIPEKWSRVGALSVLAAHLPNSDRRTVIAEALHVARAIPDPDDRQFALRVLVPYLSDADRDKVVAEELRRAEALSDNWYRSYLRELAPYLPESLMAEGLRAAVSPERDVRHRELVVSDGPLDDAAALRVLAPRLSEPLLAEALRSARRIRTDEELANALACLAPQLPEPLLGEALLIARGIDTDRHRAKALSALVSHLPEPLQEKAFDAFIKGMRSIKRSQFLDSLPAFFGTMLRLESVIGLREIGRSVRDTGRWFP
jgi:hypothetical protein